MANLRSVCFTPKADTQRSKKKCPLWVTGGHSAVQTCPLNSRHSQAVISRENFLSAYSHPFAGASLFRSGHSHIHIERACIEHACEAAMAQERMGYLGMLCRACRLLLWSNSGQTRLWSDCPLRAFRNAHRLGLLCCVRVLNSTLVVVYCGPVRCAAVID